MTKRKIEYWVIPPDADGEFVAHMEVVLETYEKAYDPECPVVCMDEQPVQLIGETRVPIPATKEHAERADYECERKGTASIFMFAEPLSGFRQATARARRTKVDWAHEVAQLLGTRYAKTPRITLVCDNLNTHSMGRSTKPYVCPTAALPTSRPCNRKSRPGRREPTPSSGPSTGNSRSIKAASN